MKWYENKNIVENGIGVAFSTRYIYPIDVSFTRMNIFGILMINYGLKKCG